jgi:5-methylcytosine-specific restriction endonuclease McrA
MMTADVLRRDALVLNRNWQPVHVTSVLRALVMVWNGVARVVDPDAFCLYVWEEWAELEAPPGAPAIRTARRRLRVPEVVCLGRYDRMPRAAVTFSRRNVAKRDHHTCQYCGGQPGFEEITIDHVVPRSQGGPSTWTNCVAACLKCNARKANRTPEQAGMRLKHSPARPNWKPLEAAWGPKPPSWSKFLEAELATASA